MLIVMPNEMFHLLTCLFSMANFAGRCMLLLVARALEKSNTATRIFDIANDICGNAMVFPYTPMLLEISQT
jgi:hypothetical protein